MYKWIVLMCLFMTGCVSQQDPTTGGTIVSIDPNEVDAVIAPWLPIASAIAGLWPGWGWVLAIAGASWAAVKKFKITVPPKPETK